MISLLFIPDSTISTATWSGASWRVCSFCNSLSPTSAAEKRLIQVFSFSDVFFTDFFLIYLILSKNWLKLHPFNHTSPGTEIWTNSWTEKRLWVISKSCLDMEQVCEMIQEWDKDARKEIRRRQVKKSSFTTQKNN